MTLSERPCRLTAGARKPVGVALLSLTSLVARDEGSDERAMRRRIERCQAVLDELRAEQPRNHFTVGIVDDVTNTSLEVDPAFDIEPETTRLISAKFARDHRYAVGPCRDIVDLLNR